MSLATVLLPLFVEVILTFVLLFWSGALHSRDTEARTAKVFHGQIRLTGGVISALGKTLYRGAGLAKRGRRDMMRS